MSEPIDVNTLLQSWREDQTVVDYWLNQSWLTPEGIQGRETMGEGVITKYEPERIEVKRIDGQVFWISNDAGLITEEVKDSPDGFLVQVRTFNHSTWIVFKPHAPQG